MPVPERERRVSTYKEISVKVWKAIGRFAEIIIYLAYAAFWILSALVLVVSLMTTVVFRQYEQNDLFDFVNENIPFLLLSMLAWFALMLAARAAQERNHMAAGALQKTGAASTGKMGVSGSVPCHPSAASPQSAPFPWLLLIVAGAVSLFLVIAVGGLPTADAAQLDEVIHQFAERDYSSISWGYLRNYPFQVFYVYIGEILLRLFGEYDTVAWQLLNVIAIEFLMYFLYRITWELFESRRVCLIMQILSCGAFCLYAFSTFVYLDLVSMALSAGALYLQILYMKREKVRYEILAGVLVTLAILMKMNCLIALIAMILFLLVNALWKGIREGSGVAARLLRALTLIALLIVMQTAASSLLEWYTFLRTGTELGDGFPFIAYIAMGLQVAEGKCGWYNGFTISIWAESGYDAQKTSELAWEAIRESFAEFDNSGRYTLNFFYQKFISQWGDSTCVSMKELENTYRHTEETALADSLIFGTGSTILQWVMNVFHSMIYLGNLIYAGAVLTDRRRGTGSASTRRCAAEEAMIVIFIFGGMLFHEIWEASGRYTMRYYLTMIPLAAWGWSAAVDYVLRRLSAGRSRKKPTT